LRILPSTTILYRFFDRAYEPVYFDRTLNGRLNAPDGAYGVLYTALSVNGAFAETFLRTPGMRQIDPRLLARKAYVRLELLRGLSLIELAGPGLAALGATAEITHCGLPYTAPQAWSAALHAHPISPSGIAYHSRHDDREECAALFEDRNIVLREVDRTSDLDADWFWQLAEQYGRASPPA
jgi:hypothetical protein